MPDALRAILGNRFVQVLAVVALVLGLGIEIISGYRQYLGAQTDQKTLVKATTDALTAKALDGQRDSRPGGEYGELSKYGATEKAVVPDTDPTKNCGLLDLDCKR